jgi:hypothetical protein
MENNVSTENLRQNIPGISWTMAPKTLAWQRPPKYAAVSDVLQSYIEKMSSPEAIKRIVSMLKETKQPVSVVAEMIMLMGVNAGAHTIDAGVLVMPVLMELIKTAAMIEGIDFVDFPDDGRNKEDEVEPEVIDNAVKRAFTSMQVAADSEPSGGLMSKKKEVM